MTPLSLWLDSYDDIYSDFDSRLYHKRRVSEDFVDELKAALKYRPEIPEALLLLLPPKKRDAKAEFEIVPSLKVQFDQRRNIIFGKETKIRKRGLMMLLSGVVIMVADSLISYKGGSNYVTGLVRIIMEPAGWFMLWNGLDFLLYEYRTLKKEADIYRTMAELRVHFADTE